MLQLFLQTETKKLEDLLQVFLINLDHTEQLQQLKVKLLIQKQNTLKDLNGIVVIFLLILLLIPKLLKQNLTMQRFYQSIKRFLLFNQYFHILKLACNNRNLFLLLRKMLKVKLLLLLSSTSFVVVLKLLVLNRLDLVIIVETLCKILQLQQVLNSFVKMLVKPQKTLT